MESRDEFNRRVVQPAAGRMWRSLTPPGEAASTVVFGLAFVVGFVAGWVVTGLVRGWVEAALQR